MSITTNYLRSNCGKQWISQQCYRNVSKGKSNGKSDAKRFKSSPWIPRFYIQHKILKQGNPVMSQGEPVISSINYHTSNIPRCIYYLLQVTVQHLLT